MGHQRTLFLESTRNSMLTSYPGDVCKFQQNLSIWLSLVNVSHKKQTLGNNVFILWAPQKTVILYK